MFDIKFGALLPWTFRLLASCAFILGLSVLPVNLWIGIPLSVLSFFALVAYEGTEINSTNKTYREYTSFLFFKAGKFQPYTDINKIFINRSKESQKMYTAHTLHSSTFEDVVYNAWLKFSNGEKIHLLKSKSKDRLMRVLKPLSEAIQVEITDHS